MEYSCPQCGDNLRHRLLKSNYFYLNKNDLLAIYSTPSCPSFGASLTHNLEKIENKLFTYFAILFIAFIVTFILLTIAGITYNPLWAILSGVIIFGSLIAYAAWFHKIKLNGRNYWVAAKNSNNSSNLTGTDNAPSS